MPTNRFMVIKVRELLKTIAFAVIGVVVIVCLVYFVMGKVNSVTAQYNPGKYSAEIELESGNLIVEVAVSKNKIKAVEVISQSETVPVFYPLFSSVAQEVGDLVVEEQTVDIILPEESGVTASLVLDAIKDGLLQAEK